MSQFPGIKKMCPGLKQETSEKSANIVISDSPEQLDRGKDL